MTSLGSHGPVGHDSTRRRSDGGPVRRGHDELEFVLAVPFRGSQPQPHDERQVGMLERHRGAAQPRHAAAQDVELLAGLDFGSIGEECVLDLRHASIVAGRGPRVRFRREGRPPSSRRVAWSLVEGSLNLSLQLRISLPCSACRVPKLGVESVEQTRDSRRRSACSPPGSDSRGSSPCPAGRTS